MSTREQLLDQDKQKGYVCNIGSYCSPPITTTTVPNSGGGIQHRTTTTIVNGRATTDVYIFRQDTILGIPVNQGSWVKAGTTTDGGNTYTFNNERDSNGNLLVGEGVRQSLASGGDMNRNVKAQVTRTLRGANVQPTPSTPNLSPEQINQVTSNRSTAGDNQSPSEDPDGGGEPTDEERNDLEEEAGTIREGTRTNYGGADLRYPEGLSVSKQDCIKFSIYQYVPPGLGADNQSPSRIVGLTDGNPSLARGTPLATIVLPIPSGISDSNTVSWMDDSIGEFEEIIGNIAASFMESGGSEGVKATQEGIGRVQGNEKDVENVIIGKLTQAALGNGAQILQRRFGVVSNNNLELLFNSPDLRNFTFNFRMTPRTPKEAKNVRAIIRAFKQAMSVKRSKSSFLLKSPHTFAISYVSENQQHPYLNKFKECALTNCSVSYTPDGSYMTYDGPVNDRSMTAYELQLTFQELEPIFDDEYGTDYNNVGF